MVIWGMILTSLFSDMTRGIACGTVVALGFVIIRFSKLEVRPGWENMGLGLCQENMGKHGKTPEIEVQSSWPSLPWNIDWRHKRKTRGFIMFYLCLYIYGFLMVRCFLVLLSGSTIWCPLSFLSVHEILGNVAVANRLFLGKNYHQFDGFSIDLSMFIIINLYQFMGFEKCLSMFIHVYPSSIYGPCFP